MLTKSAHRGWLAAALWTLQLIVSCDSADAPTRTTDMPADSDSDTESDTKNDTADESASVDDSTHVPSGHADAAARDAGTRRESDASQVGSTSRDASSSALRDAGKVSTGNGDGGMPGTAPPTSVSAGDCTGLPAVTDYNAKGPFADAKMFTGLGPSSNYTMYRPDSSLGKDGFKHPIATWGNGILTTPDEYQQLLTLIASHGFVIIACNDTMAERPCLSDGMDWLIAQNASGALQGKLDVSREVTIGYSWGGGAAIDTANRPNVKATVSLHGMPPRETNAFADMHAPLLLFTSTGDSFVTPDGYVTPNYEKAKTQTFYATLGDMSVDHLYIVDEDAQACVVSSALGACGSAKQQRAPALAWLRFWACDDQGAKPYFYGADCTLCKAPWSAQRKNWPP